MVTSASAAGTVATTADIAAPGATEPPNAAVVIAIGTRQKMSAPSRWKNSCGLIDRKM